MDTINRTVAIIKPRAPYLDWARTISNPIDISLEELRRDCTAVLLPEVADDAEAEAAVRALAEELFIIELAAWHADEATWPEQRDDIAFQAWFEVEFHSVVLDSVRTPIRRERYEPG